MPYAKHMANLCKEDMIRTVILSKLLVFPYERIIMKKVENVFALLLGKQVLVMFSFQTTPLRLEMRNDMIVAPVTSF